MNTAEILPFEPDKVEERAMAEHLRLTFRALQTRRLKGKIPHGVWNKVNGDIIYSKRRYDEWLESTWACPPELSLLGTQSASGLPGAARPRRGAVKPSGSRKPPRGSKLPPTHLLV